MARKSSNKANKVSVAESTVPTRTSSRVKKQKKHFDEGDATAVTAKQEIPVVTPKKGDGGLEDTDDESVKSFVCTKKSWRKTLFPTKEEEELEEKKKSSSMDGSAAKEGLADQDEEESDESSEDEQEEGGTSSEDEDDEGQEEHDDKSEEEEDESEGEDEEEEEESEGEKEDASEKDLAASEILARVKQIQREVANAKSETSNAETMEKKEEANTREDDELPDLISHTESMKREKEAEERKDEDGDRKLGLPTKEEASKKKNRKAKKKATKKRKSGDTSQSVSLKVDSGKAKKQNKGDKQKKAALIDFEAEESMDTKPPAKATVDGDVLAFGNSLKAGSSIKNPYAAKVSARDPYCNMDILKAQAGNGYIKDVMIFGAHHVLKPKILSQTTQQMINQNRVVFARTKNGTWIACFHSPKLNNISPSHYYVLLSMLEDPKAWENFMVKCKVHGIAHLCSETDPSMPLLTGRTKGKLADKPWEVLYRLRQPDAEFVQEEARNWCIKIAHMMTQVSEYKNLYPSAYYYAGDVTPLILQPLSYYVTVPDVLEILKKYFPDMTIQNILRLTTIVGFFIDKKSMEIAKQMVAEGRGGSMSYNFNDPGVDAKSLFGDT